MIDDIHEELEKSAGKTELSNNLYETWTLFTTDQTPYQAMALLSPTAQPVIYTAIVRAKKLDKFLNRLAESSWALTLRILAMTFGYPHLASSKFVEALSKFAIAAHSIEWEVALAAIYTARDTRIMSGSGDASRILSVDIDNVRQAYHYKATTSSIHSSVKQWIAKGHTCTTCGHWQVNPNIINPMTKKPYRTCPTCYISKHHRKPKNVNFRQFSLRLNLESTPPIRSSRPEIEGMTDQTSPVLREPRDTQQNPIPEGVNSSSNEVEDVEVEDVEVEDFKVEDVEVEDVEVEDVEVEDVEVEDVEVEDVEVEDFEVEDVEVEDVEVEDVVVEEKVNIFTTEEERIAKLEEIKRRPSRKDTFGLLLASARAFREDPHNELEGCRQTDVPIFMNEFPIGSIHGGLEEVVTQPLKVISGLPDNAILILHNGQLAFKSVGTGPRSLRPRTVYKIGKI
jgi:hypothetical protein